MLMSMREDRLEIDEAHDEMLERALPFPNYKEKLAREMPEEVAAVRQALEEGRIGGLHPLLAYVHPLALRAVAALAPTLTIPAEQNESWEAQVRDQLLDAIAAAVANFDSLSHSEKALLRQLAPECDLKVVQKALKDGVITPSDLEEILDSCGTGYKRLLVQLEYLDLEAQYNW
jgi:hypothetical protein